MKMKAVRIKKGPLKGLIKVTDENGRVKHFVNLELKINKPRTHFVFKVR